MSARHLLLLVVGPLYAALAVLAQSSDQPPSSQGALLYDRHCIACHSTQIHWREKKLATDWASLVHQVRRWQANTGLGWSDEEVDDVARYLNSTIYKFQEQSKKRVG